MTEADFTQWTATVKKQWPFLAVNEETAQTLWGKFGGFPLMVATDAVKAYADSDLDLNLRTFKWGALLHFCFEQQQTAGGKMTWTPADEATLAIELQHRAKCGTWTERSELEIVTSMMGKPQMPDMYQRAEAVRALQEMGAKPVHEVDEEKAYHNRAYNAFLRAQEDAQRQARLKNRERGAKARLSAEEKEDAEPIASYMDRARKMVSNWSRRG